MTNQAITVKNKITSTFFDVNDELLKIPSKCKLMMTWIIRVLGNN